MGNSGGVSQGRCGGGAQYCGPRGTLLQFLLIQNKNKTESLKAQMCVAFQK